MSRCECGSYAINPNLFPRKGEYLELCDVCYFKTQLEEVEKRLAEARAMLLMSNALPRITDEIYSDYVGEVFIEIENGKPQWTQAAIDFACLLDGQKCPQQEGSEHEH